jgi:hypothetical protein
MSTLVGYSLHLELERVRAYWLASQRGGPPAHNPLDALEPDARRRVGYDVYLRSRAWRTFRAEMLELVHGTCEHCGVCELESLLLVLDVHHRRYDRLGDERADDVLVLCRPCHDSAHQ